MTKENLLRLREHYKEMIATGNPLKKKTAQLNLTQLEKVLGKEEVIEEDSKTKKGKR